jgi:hypothetical protein
LLKIYETATPDRWFRKGRRSRTAYRRAELPKAGIQPVSSRIISIIFFGWKGFSKYASGFLP